MSGSPFLQNLYADLLKRAPDASGLNHWSSLLSAGSSNADVALAVMDSVETRTRFVRDQYRSYLNRDPDADGQATFTGMLSAGSRVEDVQANILGSGEFYQNAGGTNSAFLAALYQAVLQRAIDASEAADFGGQLDTGVSRVDVAKSVLTSEESYRLLVTDLYQNLLLRGPDDPGLQAWLGSLHQGMTYQEFVAGIAGSGEYQANLVDSDGDGILNTIETHAAGNSNALLAGEASFLSVTGADLTFRSNAGTVLSNV